MKIVATLFIAISLITAGCGSGARSAEEAQADPAATAETIFYLIQNEKYDALPDLIDESADEDARQLADLKNADETTQKQTREYFESASVNGEPVIDGDNATVKVNAGHNGTFEETFEMVKKNGKWYLVSY